MLREIDAQSPSILISDVKQEEKAHPWRRCPKGMHFVREHETHISIVREHCAKNPSGKEELNHEEIQYITERYFDGLIGPPTAGVLKFIHADNYDKEIRGWTQYWNEIYKPNDKLDPNLIKALIATESGFRLDPPENKTARGLMQIRNDTRGYLQGVKNELVNHLVIATLEEYLEPSTNICGGVRWLFRKKELASHKLKREASWLEAIADYKSYLDAMKSDKDYIPDPMKKLNEYYLSLQQT